MTNFIISLGFELLIRQKRFEGVTLGFQRWCLVFFSFLAPNKLNK